VVRVRFAPSPTGKLHIGGARTALFNWLFARREGGSFVLRIEDTDVVRSRIEYEEEIKKDLLWLGIDWDEGPDKGGSFGPYRQSQRTRFYIEAIEALQSKGLVYRCFCTPEELAELREHKLAKGQMPIYNGRCRNLTASEIDTFLQNNKPFVWRFKMPQKDFSFYDIVRKRVSISGQIIGDFILMKSNNTPSYNFAAVVDDYNMKITHIIRGEEHLTNTPRQLALYEALGLNPPQFAHISLILSPDGTKMSKREGFTSVGDFFKAGYLPEAMVNFLAFLGWAPAGDREIYSLSELKEIFSLERVSQSPAIFNLKKLDWLNTYYLREIYTPEKRLKLLLPFLVDAGLISLPLSTEEEKLLSFRIEAVKTNLTRGIDIVNALQIFYSTPQITPYTFSGLGTVDKLIKVFLIFKDGIKGWDEYNEKEFLKLLKEASKYIKGKPLYLALRLALTGMSEGIKLELLLPALGKEEIERRLEVTLNALIDFEKGNGGNKNNTRICTD